MKTYNNSTYKTAFGGYFERGHVLAALPARAFSFRDWADTSYGNDMMPSFTNTRLGVVVWIDFTETIDDVTRGHNGGELYSVSECDAEGDNTKNGGLNIFETSDLEALEKWLLKRAIATEKAERKAERAIPYRNRVKVKRDGVEYFITADRLTTATEAGRYVVKAYCSERVKDIREGSEAVEKIAREAFPAGHLGAPFLIPCHGLYVAVSVMVPAGSVLWELDKPRPELRPELACYPNYDTYHAALVSYLERHPDEIGGK